MKMKLIALCKMMANKEAAEVLEVIQDYWFAEDDYSECARKAYFEILAEIKAERRAA